MRKLYIPTSTLNFNNILATESISPIFFYSERMFGYKRFTNVDPNNLRKYLLLYSKIPLYHIKNDDIDSYPLIIEISEELLSGDYINTVNVENDIEIIQYNKTIYLHPNKVKFIFLSEKEKKICLIKSEPSIETKLLPIYMNTLEILSNENTFEWGKSITEEIKEPEINSNIFDYIHNDLITDKLKGFYFCYHIGIIESIKLLRNKSTKIDELKYSIKEDVYSIKEKYKKIIELYNFNADEFLELDVYCQNIISTIKDISTSVQNKDSRNEVPTIKFSNYRITQFDDIIYKKKGAEIYQSILNDLLDYPIYDEISFLENRVDLTIKIGGILKEYVNNWENSPIRSYLNALLDNIENYKEFELNTHLKNDSSKYLLQSIAVFIMNGNDPHNLLDKLNKYNLDPRVSFGLFGVVFGFSSIPKTISNTLFKNDNLITTKRIYKEVQNELHYYPISDDINIKQTNLSEETTSITSTVDTASNEAFNKTKENTPISCSVCGKEMIIRTNSKNSDKFYGCTGYPKCKNTEQITLNNNNNEKQNELIFNYVKQNGESKITDIIKHLDSTNKIQRKGKYTVKELKDTIPKDNRLIITKIGRANGVKIK